MDGRRLDPSAIGADMIPPVPLPPITEMTFILAILIAVIAAGWVAWVLGYDKGFRDGAERNDAKLRRNLNLPPRPQR